jgi:hypothetical protein
MDIGVYDYSVYISLAVRCFKHVSKIGISVFLLFLGGEIDLN